MREYFDSLGIELIDFKIEFGRTMDRSFWPTRFLRIPADCGIRKRMKNWIRTVSAAIWVT